MAFPPLGHSKLDISVPPRWLSLGACLLVPGTTPLRKSHSPILSLDSLATSAGSELPVTRCRAEGTVVRVLSAVFPGHACTQVHACAARRPWERRCKVVGLARGVGCPGT